MGLDPSALPAALASKLGTGGGSAKELDKGGSLKSLPQAPTVTVPASSDYDADYNTLAL